MSDTKNLTDIAAKSLGDSTSYAIFSDQFDSSLLNPMPRSLARNDWGIKGDEFLGEDVWHCHEATFLTKNGLPVTGTLKFSYSASTEMMVESKSMKLYLNSFDMCKLGHDGTIRAAIYQYVEQVKKDLESILNTSVKIHFFREGSKYDSTNFLQDFTALEDCIPNLETIEFTDYTTEKNHLVSEELWKDDNVLVKKYKIGILRSRCRHTKQKDTGSAYITIVSRGYAVNPLSLLKHVISLREQNEFHEFCAEKIFCDLKNVKGVLDVGVTLLYTRRGSLDINPIRVSSEDLIPLGLNNENIYTTKTQGQ